MSVIETQYWIEELRRGNQQSLKWFYDRYNKPLIYFACELIDDRKQAEDTVIETFSALWQKRNSFESHQAVRSFLYLSVKNACINHLHHLKVRSAYQKKVLETVLPDENLVENKVIFSELMQFIYKEVENLPDGYREVIQLLFIEGMDHQKVAESLDISAGNLRVRKLRAIGLLKDALLKKGLSPAYLFLLPLLVSGSEGLGSIY